MTRYASETKVPIEKTRAEIESTVRRYGADAFNSGWEGDRAFVLFRCEGRYVRFTMGLPARDDPAFTAYKQGSVTSRKPEEARKRWDQACRQKWRALALMIKAKLEAIERAASSTSRRSSSPTSLWPTAAPSTSRSRRHWRCPTRPARSARCSAARADPGCCNPCGAHGLWSLLEATR